MHLGWKNVRKNWPVIYFDEKPETEAALLIKGYEVKAWFGIFDRVFTGAVKLANSTSLLERLIEKRKNRISQAAAQELDLLNINLFENFVVFSRAA